MIIAAFDFETTGTRRKEDRIIEVGVALYSTGRNRVLEQTSFLVDNDGVPIHPKAEATARIDQEMIDMFGVSQEDAIITLQQYFDAAEAVMGHNIVRFDLPFYRNAVTRLTGRLPGPEKPAIDTMYDIPGVKGTKLITMCADAKDPKTGKDVSFTYEKHCALDDAKAVVRLTSWHDYEAISVRAASPLLPIFSQHGNTTANNKIARDGGFRWNGNYKVWWQEQKEQDLPALAQSYQFPFGIAPKEITLELLRDDE